MISTLLLMKAWSTQIFPSVKICDVDMSDLWALNWLIKLFDSLKIKNSFFLGSKIQLPTMYQKNIKQGRKRDRINSKPWNVFYDNFISLWWFNYLVAVTYFPLKNIISKKYFFNSINLAILIKLLLLVKTYLTV